MLQLSKRPGHASPRLHGFEVPAPIKGSAGWLSAGEALNDRPPEETSLNPEDMQWADEIELLEHQMRIIAQQNAQIEEQMQLTPGSEDSLQVSALSTAEEPIPTASRPFKSAVEGGPTEAGESLDHSLQPELRCDTPPRCKYAPSHERPFSWDATKKENIKLVEGEKTFQQVQYVCMQLHAQISSAEEEALKEAKREMELAQQRERRLQRECVQLREKVGRTEEELHRQCQTARLECLRWRRKATEEQLRNDELEQKLLDVSRMDKADRNVRRQFYL